jgi:hypothetical protein
MQLQVRYSVVKNKLTTCRPYEILYLALREINVNVAWKFVYLHFGHAFKFCVNLFSVCYKLKDIRKVRILGLYLKRFERKRNFCLCKFYTNYYYYYYYHHHYYYYYHHHHHHIVITTVTLYRIETF